MYIVLKGFYFANWNPNILHNIAHYDQYTLCSFYEREKSNGRFGGQGKCTLCTRVKIDVYSGVGCKTNWVQ